MAKVSLIVEYQLKPGQRQAFEKIIRDHAEGTIEEEAGCLQFDVLMAADDPDRAFVYEVYADDAALEAHKQSPRMPTVRAAYADMLVDRWISVCTVVS